MSQEREFGGGVSSWNLEELLASGETDLDEVNLRGYVGTALRTDPSNQPDLRTLEDVFRNKEYPALLRCAALDSYADSEKKTVLKLLEHLPKDLSELPQGTAAANLQPLQVTVRELLQLLRDIARDPLDSEDVRAVAYQWDRDFTSVLPAELLERVEQSLSPVSHVRGVVHGPEPRSKEGQQRQGADEPSARLRWLTTLRD
jgi:hypothetical protein